MTKILKKKLVCIGDAYGDCNELALYIRHTQFAGSHPLCAFHAIKDKDFLKEDSYEFWEKLTKEIS
jgi:hypothetical protein